MKSMFMGEYHHNIDAKGRLIIPAKFREQLGEEAVFTRGMDGCIFGYSKDEWSNVEDKLKQLPLTKKDARAFTRTFYAGAMEGEFDKQGRINISDVLKKHAALVKECVIVGVSERIEIWSAERWNEFDDNATANFDEISENLMDFDL